MYYMRFVQMERFWKRAEEGGRKSFRYEELNPDYIIPSQNGLFIPYLEILKKDLDDRE